MRLLASIAREVTHATIAETAERLTLWELRYWGAYFAEEGTAQERDDLRCAAVSHTVAHTACYEHQIRKRRKGFKMAEFIPFARKRERTPEKLNAKLMAFVGILKGNSKG